MEIRVKKTPLCLLLLGKFKTLSGFFGKLYILISAIESKLYLLAIIAVLTSIISAFYYIKIIKTIFFDKPINDIYINISTISKLIIVVTLIISIFLIIFLSDFLEIINAASLISNWWKKNII